MRVCKRRWTTVVCVGMITGILFQMSRPLVYRVWAETSMNTAEPKLSQESSRGESPREKVTLGIDNRHIYEGMQESYAEGYLPAEEGNTLRLVVPFTANGELAGAKLTVGLDFEGVQISPFLIRNYQEDLEEREFSFGEEKVKCYLYSVTIPLDPERDAGKYPVKVKAVGKDGAEEQVVLEYTVFAQVSGGSASEAEVQALKEGPGMSSGVPDEEASSDGKIESGETVVRQPKFILEANSLEGTNLEAGSTGEAELSFRNMSKEYDAYNLKITVIQEGGNLAFSRNAEYFERVRAGEAVVLREEFQVQRSAEQGSLPVQFQFEYEDDKGNTYSSTELCTFYISQPVEISLSGCSISQNVYSTDTVESVLQIVNLGRAPVYNVRVTLKGSGLFAVQPYFGGTLEAGQELQGNLRIYVGSRDMESMQDKSDGTDEEKYGETEGTFLLEYEDAFGQTYSQEVAYNTKIQAPQILSLKQEAEPPETNQWWISVLILAGFALVAGVAVQTCRLRKAKKNLADLRWDDHEGEG